MIYENFVGNKAFCEQLFFYRKEKRLSQDQLGENVGLSRGYINKFENGLQIPRRELCEKIANALGLSGDDFHYFVKAAAKAFLLNCDYKGFFDSLAEFDVETLEQTNFVPLFECPTKKIVPPYKNQKPIRYYPVHKDIVKPKCYAILYQEEYTTKEIEYKPGDILIINPNFEHLNLGDYVLVKIFNAVHIRVYHVIQDQKRAYVHFLPYPVSGEETVFDPIADNKKFEIFGKVVAAVKTY